MFDKNYADLLPHTHAVAQLLVAGHKLAARSMYEAYVTAEYERADLYGADPNELDLWMAGELLCRARHDYGYDPRPVDTAAYDLLDSDLAPYTHEIVNCFVQTGNIRSAALLYQRRRDYSDATNGDLWCAQMLLEALCARGAEEIEAGGPLEA